MDFKSWLNWVPLVLIALSSCTDINELDSSLTSTTPRFKSFIFKSSLNPTLLLTDITCDIKNDTLITVMVPYIMNSKNMISSFEFDGTEVISNGMVQESGVTENDFSKPLKYAVKGSNGEERHYTVEVHAFTGLPIVYIQTEGNKAVDSKEIYVDGQIRIVEDIRKKASGDVFESPMKIRGRGNSTWDFAKKPYKIKFDKKQSLLGEPADKEWVLLANYTDKTMLRNKVGFLMGEISTLAWTSRTHFVELFINNHYQGTYQLAEQIKVASSRVNISDEGYLLEIDQVYRLDADDVYFKTNSGLLYNIKEPKVEVNSEQYEYIKNYLQEVENVIMSAQFADPDRGYANLIDVESYVDWYLINEIAKNNDACFYSSCYLNLTPGGKLKMGPLWDFDIAFGNINYNNNEGYIGFWVKDVPLIARLFQDPGFTQKVKERFAYYKSNQNLILNNINEYSEYLAYSVQENNNKWKTLYAPTWPNYAVTGAYNNEVVYLKQWIINRMDWLEKALAEL